MKKVELADNTPSGTQGFWFNLRREKFQDPRVREAIGLMFNFEWSNETLFYGLYARTDSFFENSPMQAEGLPQGEELAVLEEFRDRLPPEIFTEPAYVPPVSGKNQLDRGNMRKASALLDEAGWTVGSDGLRRNAKGETLTVDFIDDTKTFERVIDPYVANLQRIGVDAKFTLVDAAQMQQRQEEFNYDIVPGRFTMSFSPSIELRQFFTTESASAQGSANLSGIADPVVDALVEKVIAVDDHASSWTRAPRRWTGCCGRRASGCRTGTAASIWSPIGTCSDMPAEQPPYSRGDGLWWSDDAKLGAHERAGRIALTWAPTSFDGFC